jgi:hypothetical protein
MVRSLKSQIACFAIFGIAGFVATYNIGNVYAACQQGCHLGVFWRDSSTATGYSDVVAAVNISWTSGGVSGSFQTNDEVVTATQYLFYTTECGTSTPSWCSGLDGANTNTLTTFAGTCSSS